MKEKIKKLFDTSTTRGKIMRTVLFLLILTVICVLGYFILRWTGLWEKVNSIDKIRDIVARGGAFSFIIFIIFQILQTTVLQIPAMFVTIAGAVIFGRWQAFIMSYVAVMIGSVIMFWIGRKAGRPFLYWLVGKDTGEIWIERMSNGKYLFFLMMLFPMFPDDILCVVAGLTNMSFPFFFWTNMLARGVGILCTVYFGSGAIIPYHGWGLVVWAILIVLMIVLFYLSVKYKSKIDIIINKIFRRKPQTPETATLTTKNAQETTTEQQSANITKPQLTTETAQAATTKPLSIEQNTQQKNNVKTEEQTTISTKPLSIEQDDQQEDTNITELPTTSENKPQATVDTSTNNKDKKSENSLNNKNINITNNSADNKNINANITNNSANNKDKNNG